MKKTMRYIGMAALALVGTVIMGCSENDLVENSPKGKTVTLTTTISLDGGATTRALDAQGKKTFAEGDQIAIFYKNTSGETQLAESDPLKADDITNGGKTAKITVTFKNPQPEGQLRYIYPKAMARSDFGPIDDIDDEHTINIDNLQSDQNGILDSLASRFDLAIYDDKFTKDAELPGSATLENQLAIAELTIKDDAGTKDITNTIKNLVIKYGYYTYTVTREAAAGPIYVAMMPTETAKEDITFTASDGTTIYEKDVKDVTLKANNIYPVTVETFKVVDVSQLTSDYYTAQNGEMLTGTLEKYRVISIAAGATVTLKNLTIALTPSNNFLYSGITCEGDATIILEGNNTVKSISDDYPGIYAAHNPKSDNPSSADYEPEYTLTIKGDGSLIAEGGEAGAGIGSGSRDQYAKQCGNIVIEGGSITATGGSFAAGIGSGNDGNCGTITITSDVTSVTATKGTGGLCCISRGINTSTCGKVTIGDKVYWDGSDYQNGGDTYLTQATITYQPGN